MTYEKALEKIHSLLTFGSRPGLDRMRELLNKLENPQDRLKYIHVAGTNGKGSVCAMLSSALVAAGYKTGLFISPYITDFRERIQINNIPIDKETLADAVEKTFPTNVIKPPLCAVITTIGLDHTAVLGDTIELIAEQKCGIIKHGSAVVTSAQDSRAMNVIKETAGALGVPLIKSDEVELEVISESLRGSRVKYESYEFNIPLAGAHQIENAKTAVAALKYLDKDGSIGVESGCIARGFEKAVNPARLELLCEDPIVLLDGAHNPNGIGALKEAIKKFLPDKKIICVTGMLADKDIDSSIALLSGVFESVYTVPVDNPRAISADLLAEKYKAVCKNTKPFDSSQSAFDEALFRAKAENCTVLICGSLYLAGELRPYMISQLKKS